MRHHLTSTNLMNSSLTSSASINTDVDANINKNTSINTSMSVTQQAKTVTHTRMPLQKTPNQVDIITLKLFDTHFYTELDAQRETELDTEIANIRNRQEAFKQPSQQLSQQHNQQHNQQQQANDSLLQKIKSLFAEQHKTDKNT